MTVRVLAFDTIDSTNAEARRLAEAGERGPLWITADRQTAGRGRLGRFWVSEPGNLHATLLLSTAGDARLATQLGFVASLAVYATAAELLGSAAGLALKWPNDILRDGRKTCGILSESIVAESAGLIAAIGIGLNLAYAPEGTPYPVAALGADIAPGRAFGALQTHMARELAAWNAGKGFDDVRSRWSTRAIGIGGSVRVEQNRTWRKGVFEGLAADGALVLRETLGARVSIHAGDVHFDALDALRATA